MKKIHFFVVLVALLASCFGVQAKGDSGSTQQVKKLELSDKQWRERLTPEQFKILRKAGTERAWSSALNGEKRAGVYHCAACGLPLFKSSMKYNSGTGWPSFYQVIEGNVKTSLDFGLIYPRTEYHCARCGGHHGHVFKDGPQPTGQRWCNNGAALIFVPEGETLQMSPVLKKQTDLF